MEKETKINKELNDLKDNVRVMFYIWLLFIIMFIVGMTYFGYNINKQGKLNNNIVNEINLLKNQSLSLCKPLTNNQNIQVEIDDKDIKDLELCYNKNNIRECILLENGRI